jgi:hypothetical protein
MSKKSKRNCRQANKQGYKKNTEKKKEIRITDDFVLDSGISKLFT